VVIFFCQIVANKFTQAQANGGSIRLAVTSQIVTFRNVNMCFLASTADTN